MLELVELEVRELFEELRISGDTIAIVRGSALQALNGDAKWEGKIHELMEAVDKRTYRCRAPMWINRFHADWKIFSRFPVAARWSQEESNAAR